MSPAAVQLVAERLALIQGHLSAMPTGVVSGALILDGALLVALVLPGHALGVSGETWTIDGVDITQLTQEK